MGMQEDRPRIMATRRSMAPRGAGAGRPPVAALLSPHCLSSRRDRFRYLAFVVYRAASLAGRRPPTALYDRPFSLPRSLFSCSPLYPYPRFLSRVPTRVPTPPTRVKSRPKTGLRAVVPTRVRCSGDYVARAQCPHTQGGGGRASATQGARRRAANRPRSDP